MRVLLLWSRLNAGVVVEWVRSKNVFFGQKYIWKKKDCPVTEDPACKYVPN